MKERREWKKWKLQVMQEFGYAYACFRQLAAATFEPKSFYLQFCVELVKLFESFYLQFLLNL